MITAWRSKYRHRQRNGYANGAHRKSGARLSLSQGSTALYVLPDIEGRVPPKSQVNTCGDHSPDLREPIPSFEIIVHFDDVETVVLAVILLELVVVDSHPVQLHGICGNSLFDALFLLLGERLRHDRFILQATIILDFLFFRIHFIDSPDPKRGDVFDILARKGSSQIQIGDGTGYVDFFGPVTGRCEDGDDDQNTSEHAGKNEFFHDRTSFDFFVKVRKTKYLLRLISFSSYRYSGLFSIRCLIATLHIALSLDRPPPLHLLRLFPYALPAERPFQNPIRLYTPALYTTRRMYSLPVPARVE